jgi:hypothetical protein
MITTLKKNTSRTIHLETECKIRSRRDKGAYRKKTPQSRNVRGQSQCSSMKREVEVREKCVRQVLGSEKCQLDDETFHFTFLLSEACDHE